MNFAIEIHEQAKTEISDGYQHYCLKYEQGAVNFEKEISEAFDLLKKDSADYREMKSGARFYPIKIFPYPIYYPRISSEKKLQIIAILHKKRSKDFIEERID